MERQTRQRAAIWAHIEKAKRPLSPQEMLEGARRTVPRLGIATIYRAINALVEEGKLVPVSIAGEPSRYEVSGLAHHHHFYCRACSKVYELEGCVLKEEYALPPDFKVDDHDVTFFGRCPRCRKK